MPAGTVVGARSVLRALAAGGVRIVLVAADVASAASDDVRAEAGRHGVAVHDSFTARELGEHCGISRPVLAAADLSPPS